VRAPYATARASYVDERVEATKGATLVAPFRAFVFVLSRDRAAAR
jgi:hypothetical protein